MVPGITHIFVRNYMEIVFERSIRNERTDRYNIMCCIDAHEKEHPSSYDYGSSGGVFLLPSNSTTEALVLLGAIIDFIGCWLKYLERNVLQLCNMYVLNMRKLFQKIPVELNKQPSPREKRKSLLHAIGCGWYVKTFGQKLPPLRIRRLIKKYQKEEDEIKKNSLRIINIGIIGNF